MSNIGAVAIPKSVGSVYELAMHSNPDAHQIGVGAALFGIPDLVSRNVLSSGIYVYWPIFDQDCVSWGRFSVSIEDVAFIPLELATTLIDARVNSIDTKASYALPNAKGFINDQRANLHKHLLFPAEVEGIRKKGIVRLLKKIVYSEQTFVDEPLNIWWPYVGHQTGQQLNYYSRYLESFDRWYTCRGFKWMDGKVAVDPENVVLINGNQAIRSMREFQREFLKFTDHIQKAYDGIHSNYQNISTW